MRALDIVIKENNILNVKKYKSMRRTDAASNHYTKLVEVEWKNRGNWKLVFRDEQNVITNCFNRL